MLRLRWPEGDEWKKFLQEWKNFAITIFSPWTVCLIAITLYFAYRTAGQKTPENIAIFTFILSIFSGVTGGLISKNWMDLTEQRVLVTRGKSAIRSLVLLIFNIGSAQLRVGEYSAEIEDLGDDEDPDSDLVANWLKEEILRLNNLREEAIKSVENWTDIIPEANIRPELAKFNDEVLRVATYENQHAEIKDKLTSIEKEAGAAKEEKEQLQKQLLDVETKWKKAQDELKETRAKLDRSVLSGVVPSSGITATKVSLADLAPTKVLGLTFKRKCTKCGKEYTPTGITIGPDYCPDCNTISLGGIGVGR